MELNNYIKKDLIKINLPCKNREELFKIMHDEAYGKGYVDEDFLDGLLSREEVFPTGIKLTNYTVAIPHTEPEYIKEEFIAIIIPENPISFKLMDDETIEEEVSLIFMLGLNKPHSQLEVLKQLMALIQREELVTKLISSRDIKEIETILLENILEAS